jgi:hypothetical protein
VLNLGYDTIEQSLFKLHGSFMDPSQGCRTCHSTNTIIISNTTIHIDKYIVVKVIYRLLVLQYHRAIIITRSHHQYYLHLLMIAENFWLR